MKIQFLPCSEQSEHFVEPPTPGVGSIPDWYKAHKINYLSNPTFENNGRLTNTSIKMCMPFLDSFTNGYIQKTWCDIYVKKNVEEKSIDFYYSSSPPIINVRENPSTTQYENEYYPYEFHWHAEWVSKTPKGYSVLITHPLNRLDLPFTTMSAIIDADVYFHGKSGNIPFLIKKDFEGLIPAGTPMYQIIPIKRESWESEKGEYGIETEKRYKKQDSKFWGFYKKNMWVKKDFK